MTRRQLLKLAAAAAAAEAVTAAALAGAPMTAAPLQDLQLKKAVKLTMVETDQSVLEKFRLLRDLGFEGVEVESPSPIPRSEVLRAQDATGLIVHGVVDSAHWRTTLSDPDPSVRAQGVRALETALADADAYGATTVLLVPAVVSEAVAYDDAYRRSQAEIRKVLPVAEAHGVRIAIENVWNKFLLSPLEAAEYIDEFESPWIGAYFDIGNAVTFGWPEQWIRILGDRIFKLDIKDRHRDRHDHRGSALMANLGEGSCDWTAIRMALADVGYSGWATAEVPGGDAGRLADIGRRMDRILAL